jgi:prefoldin subunit 5
MSEEIKQETRDLPTIEKDYSQLCLQAGNIQYQIFALQQDLDAVNKRQKEVNQEGYALKVAAQAAQAETAGNK